MLFKRRGWLGFARAGRGCLGSDFNGFGMTFTL
jgi:hypothetical protein